VTNVRNFPPHRRNMKRERNTHSHGKVQQREYLLEAWGHSSHRMIHMYICRFVCGVSAGDRSHDLFIHSTPSYVRCELQDAWHKHMLDLKGTRIHKRQWPFMAEAWMISYLISVVHPIPIVVPCPAYLVYRHVQILQVIIITTPYVYKYKIF
jgi:hypothetical protein